MSGVGERSETRGLAGRRGARKCCQLGKGEETGAGERAGGQWEGERGKGEREPAGRQPGAGRPREGGGGQVGNAGGSAEQS